MVTLPVEQIKEVNEKSKRLFLNILMSNVLIINDFSYN